MFDHFVGLARKVLKRYFVENWKVYETWLLEILVEKYFLPYG